MTQSDPGAEHKRRHAEVADGQPNEVETVALAWDKLSEVTGVVADELRRRLDGIEHEWNLPENLHESLLRIEGLCQQMAEGAAHARSALNMMASQLHDAQVRLEEPPEPASTGSGADRAGLVDGGFGYTPGDAVREDALQRMIDLSADLDNWLEQLGRGIRAPWQPEPRVVRQLGRADVEREHPAEHARPDPWLIDPDP